MSVPLILTFVSTVVFAIQFLIVVDLYNHISALIRDNPRAGPGSTGTSPSIRRCRALSSTAIRSIQVLWNGRGRLSLEVIRQNGDEALTVSDTGQDPEPHPTTSPVWSNGLPLSREWRSRSFRVS